MSTTVNAIDKPAMKLRHATTETSPFVPGRREFFKYRDLGVTDATNGEMRAQVMSAITGMTEPTGVALSRVRWTIRLRSEGLGRFRIRNR